MMVQSGSAAKHASPSNTATPTRIGAGCGKRGARRYRQNNSTGANGHLSRRFQTTGTLMRSVGYGYDAAGHLSSATRAGLTTSYSYNALGQRIKKSQQQRKHWHHPLRVRPRRAPAG